MRTLDEILEQKISEKYYGRLSYGQVEEKKEEFIEELLRILADDTDPESIDFDPR